MSNPKQELPVTPHRDAVLTPEQLADVLQTTVRQIERSDLPTVYLGKRQRRYIYGQVLDTLSERAA